MPQLSTTSALSNRRARRSVSRRASAPSSLVNVVVAWSASSAGPRLGLGQVELEAQRVASAPSWTCRQPSGWSWEEALCAAGCDEVVLTTLGDDPDAKHLVLGLAEHLTHKLAATQPIVRVRFLPGPRLGA